MATDKMEIVGQLSDNLESFRGRRLPVGAQVLPQGGVHFRVWATRCQHVMVVIEGGVNAGATEQTVTLVSERDG